MWTAARDCNLHSDESDSVRLICTRYMCPNVDPFTPASWKEECVTGSCSECPTASFPVPSGEESQRVNVSLWTTKDVDGRRKYGYYQVSMSKGELSATLVARIASMKTHVYGAANSWAKLRKDEEELLPGDLLMIADYQRNYEVCHHEMPTSMGFSANSFQLAMFPIALKYRPQEGANLETAAIVFVSHDLVHCHQQVSGMQKR